MKTRDSKRIVRGVTLTLVSAGIALAGGCSNGVQGAGSGAALGSLIGMGLGSLDGKMGKGAAAGALVGAGIGAVLGDQNSRRDRGW